MAWKPPKRPADLRGVHVVDLTSTSMKEADYFSLIVSRGVTITARQDFERAKVVEKKGPPVEFPRPEAAPPPPRKAPKPVMPEDLGIQTGGGMTRNIAIVSSVVALTAGAYGLSQLIFGTSSREPAKKIENPSEFAVPAESESTEKLLESQAETRRKLREARNSIRARDDRDKGDTEEPRETSEIGKGKNRILRESGGVSYTNTPQPSVVQPQIDDRTHNAPPITDIPRDPEPQQQQQMQAMPVPNPQDNGPFHGTGNIPMGGPPTGAPPMPDRTTATTPNGAPPNYPPQDQPSFVPEQPRGQDGRF